MPLLTFRVAGLLLSLASAALAAVFVWRQPTLRRALITSSFLALAFYVVPVSTHERYLYPLLALPLPVIVLERELRWLYAAVSCTFFLNLIAVHPPVPSWSGR